MGALQSDPVNLFQNRSKIRDRRQTKTGSRQSVKTNLSTSEPRTAQSINEILKTYENCGYRTTTTKIIRYAGFTLIVITKAQV